MDLTLEELAVLYSQALMVLVVDHDPEGLEKAREKLNRDRQVFLASNAKEVFALIQRLGFSVVLVDLDLPGDAYKLIQQLNDANPQRLIVAIAGAVKASVPEATKELGVVEVLKKPITPEWKPVVERIRAMNLLDTGG